MFTVKDGGGPAVGANLQGGIVLSTADRMEKKDGAQGYLSLEGGEGPTGGIESTAAAIRPSNWWVAPVGTMPRPSSRGDQRRVSLNHVDRWGDGK